MTTDSTNNKCPVSLPQIFGFAFVPMTEADLEGFAGIEGDGYMAEVGDGYVVILDHSQDSAVIQVHGPDGTWWSLELPPEFSGPC